MRVQGALAAAVTPLRVDQSVDAAGIEALTGYYRAAGLDGLLVLGTTGEGALLSVAERQELATRFLTAAQGGLPVVVHCGAQSTRDTMVLAEHAASVAAAGVAVIPPPYYPLDDESLMAHLVAAARACAPTPFYLYEFAARSGYSIPVEVVLELRQRASNLAGLKVSDSPFDQVRPYLLEGLDVFIGAEGLIAQGLAGGAAGAVSGLAAALPELTIRAVREGTAAASEEAARVRTAIQRWPFQSALKTVLQLRGVAIEAAVRSPLRTLTPGESAELAELVRTLGLAEAQNTARSSSS
ncbi:MAG TPA: dihydrodipicolinate synthase family protein [Candidatus Dormibacteraeota bacterium]|nr:dihydrodipicolinate synthase family protein [Candidatus Dormibacteraeota bacterium]